MKIEKIVMNNVMGSWES